ncbi:MAG TPA: deoxyhypusine synthase family protein [Thermoplasmata archaeon]|nr:deoxyhypusine synthase family protein [Thermoplasmata archaeon]
MPKGGVNRRELMRRSVEPIDVTRLGGVGDLLEAFRATSIQARNLGKCLEVWENALTDRRRPTIFLGLSGPLIAAGLRKVLRDLVDWGVVDVVVSTGAVLYQDIYQSIGGRHWIGTPAADDVKLRELYLDRIYDTYVDEVKFEDTDRAIGRVTEKFPARPASSREYLEFLGREFPDPASIVATAARRGIPVFSPALIDSSIGIGLTLHYQKHRRGERFLLDAVRDNFELVQILTHSPRTAVVYIGGGTPKNWINDGIVMANYAFGREGEGHYYALQIATDVPH